MTPLPLWRQKISGKPEFVLDVSVPLAWSFAGTVSSYATGVMAKMTSAVVAVPASWSLELANLLRAAEKIGAGTAAQVNHFLARFYPLHYALDRQTFARAWGDILTLARAHSVSVFDAAYLELALRYSVPLATVDTSLKAAAIAAGIPIYTP
ncbi:MAG: hypothetical protein JWO38_3997 [Gemmataceae bacterium]|nr:hypothetical protein [Gemmataceae bacterium]